MSCAGSGRDSWGHRIIASLWSRAWVGGGGTGGRGAASLERAEGGSPIGNTRPGPAAPLASSQGPCPVLHLPQLLPKGAPQHTMPKALGCQHPSTWAPWQLAICKAPRRKLHPHTQILLSGLTLVPAKASMAPAIHSPDAFLLHIAPHWAVRIPQHCTPSAPTAGPPPGGQKSTAAPSVL